MINEDSLVISDEVFRNTKCKVQSAWSIVLEKALSSEFKRTKYKVGLYRKWSVSNDLDVH